MWVKEGRTSFLNWIKGIFAASVPAWSQIQVHIVRQDVAESETITYSTASGWTRTLIAGYMMTNTFTNAPADVGGIPTLTSSEISWTNSTGGSVTVYGWTVQAYNGTSNVLLNYKRLASPEVVANGAIFKVTPALFFDKV